MRPNPVKDKETRRLNHARNRDERLVKQRLRTDGIRSAIAMLKLEVGCSDCGYDERPEALDFDHVRGLKLFSLGNGAYTSIENVIDESEKCEVVCANCHRVRTVNRLEA